MTARRLPRWGREAGVAVGLVMTVLAAVAIRADMQRSDQVDPFPHADHQGLFPVCAGCHQGVAEGDEATTYPAPSQCSGCHDGVNEARVDWTGPTERVSNVVFDHASHRVDLEEAGDPAASCESCHSDTTVGRMSVDSSPQLETCWSCHAHERDDHFAPDGALPAGGAVPAGVVGGGADRAGVVAGGAGEGDGSCRACHVPLAESGFGRVRLEGLPVPADHGAEGFLATRHADGATADVARCATCHTADRCAACHVDASLPVIQAIPRAPATMDRIAWSSSYPTPATHEAGTWDWQHAVSESAIADCSTCHTRDDCRSCHLEPEPGPVRMLPLQVDIEAPGVAIDVAAPKTHESLFFMSAHAGLAAAAPTTCATCHTETYCVDCHDGPSNGGYHVPDFVSRHAADAYGAATECASCHSTAVFCRECHESSGFESRGRLGAGFHDAEPIWLLRHGGAARQNLENCASCHEQSDCVQCHGVLGAFRVSPHTADFDAEAAWARSPRTCIACHTSNPIGGGA